MKQSKLNKRMRTSSRAFVSNIGSLGAAGLAFLALGWCPVQGAVVSDFNDGIPDWVEPSFRGATFSESGGYLIASGNISAKTTCITENMSTIRWMQPLALANQEAITLRVDLVESAKNDVQILLQYVEPGVGGYALIKDPDEIWLTKFRWVSCGANAPFFYQEVSIKNQGVSLILELRRIGSGLEITSKVLDNDGGDGGGAVLFAKTVTDTDGVDATVPSFRGFNWSTDVGPPVVNGTAIELGVLNMAPTAQSSVRVAFDNLMYQRRPALLIEKAVSAVRLSWPASSADMMVLGAPTVGGPWQPVLEPIVDAGGTFQMTVPAPLSDTIRVFRLEERLTP